MRRRWIIAGLAAIAVAGLTVGAVVFKPWLLFIDVAVDDALPMVVESPVESPQPSETATPTPTGPVELASGSLIGHEHETSGVVRIIENPDGTRVLTLENLSTSNGPDVHVWLSAAPVVEGFDGWFLASGPAYVDLGLIKGNIGNQVYEIPADVDLSQYPSVYLWCAQFAVSFGAAAIA